MVAGNRDRKGEKGGMVFSWRPFLFSFPLAFAAAYWMARRVADGVMALAVPPIVFLFIIVLFNPLLTRWAKRFSFSPADLGTLWAILSVTTAIACGWRDAPLIAGYFIWFDSPATRYRELFLPHIPSWLLLDYRDALRAFFQGHRPFDLYRPDHLKAWLVPVLGWGGLMALLAFLMLCLLLLLAPRWLGQERLSYPIATVPLHLIRGKEGSLREGSFWIGFIFASVYDLTLGLFYWRLGRLPEEFDLSRFFPHRPWRAMGWTPFSFHPFMLALAYFIPADLALSSVLFFWFRKVQQVVTDSLGYEVQPLWGGMVGAPSPPYLTEQSIGALTALFLISLWQARPYLIVRPQKGRFNEPWRPLLQFGILGSLFGLVALIAFLMALRSNTLFLLLYLLVFLALSTTIARIRAQIGPPIHEFVGMGAHRFFVSLLGAERLGDRLITLIGIFYFTYRIWRGNPMPPMTDGFKLAHETGALRLRFVGAMVFAVALGMLTMFWAQIQSAYIWGRSGWWHTHAQAILAWRRMKNPDPLPVAFTGAGALLTLLLLWLHHRFPMLLLHPTAYALTMNFGVDFYWFPMFMTGLFKVVLVRYGGQRAFRRLIPFALGVIVGEYLIGSLWSWIFILTGRPTYIFSLV